MKKILVVLLGIVMIFSLAACQKDDGGKDQIANPWQDFETLDKAEETAGFKLDAPAELTGYPNKHIQAIKEEMIQIFYEAEAEGENVDTVLIRKGKGSEDISGDYNEYKETEEAEVNGNKVTVKGNEGKVSLAIWTEGDYSYSVSVSGGAEKETVLSIVEAVK